MIGNALEIEESIDVLRGRGPKDTVELTVRLGAEMLLAAGTVSTADEGALKISGVLGNGAALEKFRDVIAVQGGDPSVVDKPETVLPKAKNRTPIVAKRNGVVASIDAFQMGVGALLLGAGRRSVTDKIDPSVGVEICVGVGETVQKDQPLVILHENGKGVPEATELVHQAFSLGEKPLETPDTRILEVLR